MPITLDQLTEILNRADTVISLGHGRARVEYDGEYPDDEEQADMVALCVEDRDEDEEFAFTYKELLEGRLSEDGQLLIARDDDGHEHWLKFLEASQMDLKDVCDKVAEIEARQGAMDEAADKAVGGDT